MKKKPQEKNGILLDVGCGENKQGPMWTGMDIRAVDGVEIVHDMEVYPWPVRSASCLAVKASHVLEHIDPAKFGFFRWMNEAWRVLRIDGELLVSAPYGGGPRYFQDPTHMLPIVEATFAYCDPKDPYTDGHLYKVYKPMPWRIKILAFDTKGDIEACLVKRDPAGIDIGEGWLSECLVNGKKADKSVR